MPDRLEELQRQRALIQEHLAWLDREISATQGVPRTAIPPGIKISSTPPAPPPSLSPANLPIAPEINPASDEILTGYEQNPASLQQDVRRGCFMYFFSALAALFIGVVVCYFLYRRAHPDTTEPAAENFQPDTSPRR